ncbi:LysR family transcriptional regulator [Nodosilinea sp. LEGE 07088]|uniref:LysR family transcriptional regulator n=1 Tax=Nodosilinea sp. LEGE 07088 TaxID=2777968 RepID=UPI00187EB1C4|nr:LysR family transcriptional regulator [Nodosilinea sp. LEGE 07088]MBE9139371.1 LysR family transcriptional regulator [Nodosilinea sp. LEGE 07088]
MAKADPHRLKLSQLRALVAIADQGSFSDAALHMDLSQSAVSHAIATLEESLGVLLLHRGRQGAVLTSVGQLITEDARDVLRSLDNLCHQADQAKGLQTGEVRIAAFRSVATHMLPEVIRQFRQQCPEVAVAIDEKFHYEMVEKDLRQGRADVGFTYLPTHAEFDQWELLRDRYIVLLPPSSQPPPTPLSWADLANYALILPPPDDGDRQYLDRLLNRWGQQVHPAYMVREDSTIVSMVERGLGATIIAALAAEPIPAGLRVAELPEPLERVIGVIVLRDALLSPPVYAFLDQLKAIWPEALPHRSQSGPNRWAEKR